MIIIFVNRHKTNGHGNCNGMAMRRKNGVYAINGSCSSESQNKLLCKRIRTLVRFAVFDILIEVGQHIVQFWCSNTTYALVA